MSDAGVSPRRGLVLGAGGVLGAAWTIGALCALEESGFDPRSAEVIVGTSAGSVLAGLLASGVSAGDLRDHQRGLPIPAGPLSDHEFDYDRATGSALPGRPKLRMGSGRLLLHSARRLRQLPPTAVLAALVPVGRGSLDRIGEMITLVAPDGRWAPHPHIWVVAMDYETGKRVPFGRKGSPPASLAEAVTASCAIPGWFAPVMIGGRRYVDGGACSATNADLLAGLGLDEVYVLAPMAAFEFDQPASVAVRLERGWRRRVTRRLLHEAGKVSVSGTAIRLMTPGAEDLVAIGANVMDTTRRLDVLRTSLRTSAVSLRRPGSGPEAVVPDEDDLASAG
jgi:NTE family protein